MLDDKSYETYCLFYGLREAIVNFDVAQCEDILKRDYSFINNSLEDGTTLLFVTCSMKNEPDKVVEIAKLLLDYGADPNVGRVDKMTPLMTAVEMNNSKLISILINYGADVNATYFNGYTALHFAVGTHNKDIFMDLLRSGSDPFAITHSLYSVLQVAVEENFIEGVLILLEAVGENKEKLINIRLTDGSTPVFAAVREGNLELLRILIANGADCNITMQPVWSQVLSGLHAVTVAAQLNHWECIRIMLPCVDRAVVASTELDPMSAAAYAGAKESVKLLLEENFNIEGKTRAPSSAIIDAYLRPIFAREFYTPLREAVRKGHTSIVEMLLDAGAKAFYPAKCYSPFLFAFRNRIDPAIMFSFLKHDVNLNERSYNTLFDVPDALIGALGSLNRWHLINLLKCGLKPSLKNWCSCSNAHGQSLLDNVRQANYVGDVSHLMRLLLIFSPSLPGCCDAVACAANYRGPRVFPLMHICRFYLRSQFKPSELLSRKWLINENIPVHLKSYLSFDNVS